MKRSNFILFISLLIVYIDAYLILDFSSLINNLSTILKFGLFIYLFIYDYRKKKPINLFEWLVLLYLFIIAILTFIYSGHLMRILSYVIAIISLLILFRNFKYEKILEYTTIILSVFVYLNFYMTLNSPSGHFIVNGKAIYLLANNSNGIGPKLLISIVSNAMYFFYKDKMKLNLILLVIISFLTVLLVTSMTSVLGIASFIFFIILARNSKSKKILKYIIVGVLLLNVGLVYLQTEIKNDHLVMFIENVLGKNTTFSSRNIVWINSIDMIKQSPWFGYGMQPVEWYVYHIGFNTAHNFILEMLLNGGLVVAILFLFLTIIAVNNSMVFPNNKVVNILQFGCCSLLLMMTMETYSQVLIFYCLFLNYYYKLVENECRY